MQDMDDEDRKKLEGRIAELYTAFTEVFDSVDSVVNIGRWMPGIEQDDVSDFDSSTDSGSRTEEVGLSACV